MAKFLLDNGADPNLGETVIRDPYYYGNDSRYPIDFCKDDKMVNLLLNYNPIIREITREHFELTDETFKKLIDKIDKIEYTTLENNMYGINFEKFMMLVQKIDKRNIQSGLLRHVSNNKDTRIFEYLLTMGLDINYIDDQSTPLIFEIQNIKLIEKLIQLNVNVNALDKNGNNVLYSSLSDKKLIEYYINKGLDINSTNYDGNNLIHHAIKNYNLDNIDYLIKKGVNPNAQNKDGNTPLHLILMNNVPFDLTTKISPFIPSINIKNKLGETPILLAKNLDTIKLLIKNGANINDMDNNNQTILFKFIGNVSYFGDIPDIETIKYLINNGINITHTDKDGNTIIHINLFKEHIPIFIPKLNINKLNNNDENLLFNYIRKSSQNDDFECLDDYIKHGVNINQINKDGRNILHIVSMLNKHKMVHLLINNDINVNHQDNYGNTPLHYAALNGFTKIISFILNKNPNLSLVNKNNKTALQLAQEEKNEACVQLLQKVQNGGVINNKLYQELQHYKHKYLKYKHKYTSKNN